MPAWVRYGLVAGVVAFGSTLAAHLAVTLVRPADFCHAGPLIVPLLSVGALVIFITMAAAAGFKTAHVGTTAPDPTLAGLLVGVLGGCALVVLLPFVPSVEHRFQELAAVCPAPALSGGGSFSFNFGPTPPPGVVIPSPPPEFFATPPPGAVVFPPPGPGGTLGLVLHMLITILIGIGGAVGIATVAGLGGTAARSHALQRGPN